MALEYAFLIIVREYPLSCNLSVSSDALILKVDKSEQLRLRRKNSPTGMPLLVVIGWWLVKCKMELVAVGLRYKSVLIDPSS